MLMEKERLELIRFGKKLVQAQLTSGTGGNLSIRCPHTDQIAITPSGIDFFEIRPEDIVIVDIDGHVLEGHRKPSSEIEMHLMIYREREDIDAVIHAHTIYSTVLSCLRMELPAAHYMIAVAGPTVRCAEYATYGTKELAENAVRAMTDRYAVLLANHGILGGSGDLASAFHIIDQIEYCSKIYCKAKSVGEPVILSDEEMALMIKKFDTYAPKRKTK